MMAIERTTPASYSPPHGPNGPMQPLTDKQEKVVALLCQGHRNAAIAAAMGISVSTVKGHLDRIDNLFVWHDRNVPPRERIRIWGLFRRWEADQREAAMRRIEDEQRTA